MICPLKETYPATPCVKEQCAWWIKGSQIQIGKEVAMIGCSIRIIAIGVNRAEVMEEK